MFALQDFETLREKLASGETSCVNITEDYLKKIEQTKHFNTFRVVFPEEALNRAREIDNKLSAQNAGPLAGMVMAIKDVICMKGKVVTCGSRILEHFESPYDEQLFNALRLPMRSSLARQIWMNLRWDHRLRTLLMVWF